MVVSVAAAGELVFRLREGEEAVCALGEVGGSFAEEDDSAFAARDGSDADDREDEECCCWRVYAAAATRTGGAMDRFLEILARRNTGPEDTQRLFACVELSVLPF